MQSDSIALHNIYAYTSILKNCEDDVCQVHVIEIVLSPKHKLWYIETGSVH